MLRECRPSEDEAGFTLVTTRNISLRSYFHFDLYLEPFSAPLGHKYLLSQWGSSKHSAKDRRCAIRLCCLLGGLPLALDIAASYSRQNQLTLQQFLRLYKSNRSNLLRGESGSRYLHGIPSVWTPSFSTLMKSSLLLLGMLAFLNPDGVPLKLFGSYNEAYCLREVGT